MFRVRHKILFLLFICSLPINAQWINVSNNMPEGFSGKAIDAVDELNALVIVRGLGDSRLFLTKDGGVSWQDIYFPIPIFPVDVSMVDDQKFWIADETGAIYSTADGGREWELQFKDLALTEYMNYIEMFDSLNGVAMGDGVPSNPENIAHALFLTTSDGGNTWTSVNDSAFGAYSGDTWRRMDFVDQNTGYFFESGNSPQRLFKTTDQCKTWEETSFAGYAATVKFYDDQFGLVADRNGRIYRTVTGGNSWDSTNISAGWGNDIEFLPNNPGQVWFVSDKVHYSSDSGKTWSDFTFTDDSVFFRDIHFVDEMNGWLISENVIYRTTNNGGTVVNVDDNGTLPINFQLNQNYPNPFNPTTVIGFQLSTNTNVELKIYNLLGRYIRTLVDGKKSAGKHEVIFNALDLPSGIYFYSLNSGEKKITKKMILLR